MIKVLPFLKNFNAEIPIPIGRALSYVPFSKRPEIGKDYRFSKLAINYYEQASIVRKKEFIYERFFRVFNHAFNHVPFYNRRYKEFGINPKDITCFDDIRKIPIITKKDLIDVPLEDRSFKVKGRALVNTGGSSGETLSFYMDPARFGNEWAHIHYIWSNLGYKPSDLRLQFDGRSHVNNMIQYDFIRHSLRYDIYADPYLVTNRLLEVCRKYPVYYLHGYPSAIYDFAVYCMNNAHSLLDILRNTLKGAFLVSEFPNPHFRETISKVFHIPTQSLYGHTETCVMAYEKGQPYTFTALQSYGYAEAVERTPGHYNLVGTSYFNFASPLIRYDTQDGVDRISEECGILKDFEVSEGRLGEYIVDAYGKRIPLTGLIFGRHHKIFDIVKHLQIRQDTPGKATILFVSDEVDSVFENPDGVFDSSNVNIEFDFMRIESPVKTKSGKINLLVR